MWKMTLKRGRRVQRVEEIESKVETEKDKAYFSTGEVSRLLGGIVSRATVTRMFDRGRFGGQVNPLTGRRKIEWRGVIEFLKERGLSEDNIAIVEKRRGEQWTALKRGRHKNANQSDEG